jgi:hypothetical protein
MSFNPTSGYNPPDDDPASRLPRPYRRLLLAATEDDAYGWLRRHRAEVLAGGTVTAVVWPGRFRTLEGGPSFDRMAVTAAAYHMSAAIAACLTRVKGPDGLTPGQRLGVEASIARHPAGRDRNG